MSDDHDLTVTDEDARLDNTEHRGIERWAWRRSWERVELSFKTLKWVEELGVGGEVCGATAKSKAKTPLK